MEKVCPRGVYGFIEKIPKLPILYSARENPRRALMSKRPFFLLEILICLGIVSFSLSPLLSCALYIQKERQLCIEEIDFKRQVALCLLEIKIQNFLETKDFSKLPLNLVFQEEAKQIFITFSSKKNSQIQVKHAFEKKLL